MPYVNIQITQGSTREQKSQLVKEVTDSLVRILGKKPEHTHIVIQEIAEATTLAQQGFDVAPAAPPAAFAKVIADDMAKWIPVVRRSGAKVD